MARGDGAPNYQELDLDDSPDSAYSRSTTCSRERLLHLTRRQLVTIALLLCASIALGFHTAGPRAQTLAAALRGNQPARAGAGGRRGRGVLMRSGSLTNEGLGSAPQHFKSSVLLAELLDREFIMEPLQSEHGYSLSDIFNAGAAARDDLVFALPTCEVDEVGGWLWSDLKAACADPAAQAALRAKFEAKYAGCGTLFHNVKQYDWFEDGNGCVHDWFQRTVRQHVCSRHWTDEDRRIEAAQLAGQKAWWRPAQGSARNKHSPIKVGVHFRWGDTQPKPGEEVDRLRGIQVSEVNAAVATLSRCGTPLDISLYAEGLPGEVNAKFTFEHSVVDSGDGVQDVCRLGQSDVIVAGASGFAVMAYQVGHNFLQLVTDVGMFKYAGTNTTHFTVLDVDALDARVCDLLARRPDRGKAEPAGTAGTRWRAAIEGQDIPA